MSALSYSDHCLFLDDGAIKQEGTPTELYEFPRDSHVARFFEACNLILHFMMGVESSRRRLESLKFLKNHLGSKKMLDTFL